jgi:hypothetical protein
MPTKKLFLSLAIVAAMALVLSGCGKTTAEKITEKAIEKATNGQASVDYSTNTVTINTNTGSYQAGEHVTLPSDFPSDIYVIDGTLTSSSTDAPTKTFTISIDTTKSFNDAKTLYAQKIVDDGWTVSSTINYENTAGFIASKSNRNLTVSINNSSDKITVVISTYTDTSKTNLNTSTPDDTNVE